MKTIIQKLGNTLTLCIPDTFVQQAHVTQGSIANISIEDHKLVVLFPEDGEDMENLSLEQLLVGITEENIHREIETGEPLGNEVW